MSKIKILDPGYDAFTGPIAEFNFTNGVSDDDISQADVHRLSAIFRVEVVSGKAKTIGQTLLDAKDVDMVTKDHKHGITEAEKNNERKADAVRRREQTAAQAKFGYKSPKELEEIADKEGIAGLRAVAEAYGVTDRSIPALIKKIVQAQLNAGVGPIEPTGRVNDADEDEADEDDETSTETQDAGENGGAPPPPAKPAT